MAPPPTQDSLYKYCSAETAKKVLVSGNLRWSSPYLLADPLEPNQNSGLNFNSKELLDSAIKMASGLIFTKDTPIGAAPLLTAIRRWRDEERFASPEEAEGVLRELLSKMVEQQLENIEKIKNDWIKFNRSLRIASFCNKPDNLSSWSEFGDNHKGIVFRFQADGSPSIKKPQAVSYNATRGEITTLKQQIGVVLLSETYVAQDHFIDLFSSKAVDFRIQKELRCFYHQDEKKDAIHSDPANWFLDRPFGEGNLKAVYFGLATSDADKKEILGLAKKNNHSVRAFDLNLLPGKYELETVRLSDKPK